MSIYSDLERFHDLAAACGDGRVLDPVVSDTADAVSETIETLAIRVAGSDRRLSNYARRGGRLEVDQQVSGSSAEITLEPLPIWGIVLGGTRKHGIAPRDSGVLALEPPQRSLLGRRSGRQRTVPTAVRSGRVNHPGHSRMADLSFSDDLDEIPDRVIDSIDRHA